MIKVGEVAQKLLGLAKASYLSEQTYRTAMTRMKEGSDKAVFIYFWQEHAKMVCQLEDKIRWLGGDVEENGREPAWNTLSFPEDITEEDVIIALTACERRDAELLNQYDIVLKSPLPVDVRALLKLHGMKIKGIQSRVLERLARLHHQRATAPLISRLEPLINQGAVVGMDFHPRNPEDGILGEVVLQA